MFFFVLKVAYLSIEMVYVSILSLESQVCLLSISLLDLQPRLIPKSIMPFDFKKYDAKCEAMNADQLHLEWQHYTRLISGASTSTAVSGIAVPFTLGVSTIGIAVAAPAIHNARKKRAIIEKHLQKHGSTHSTRKRDVLGPMAVSSTIGVVTLGVGAVGADVIGQAGAEQGISMIVENELAGKSIHTF